jgi:hypothetical protein
MRNNLPDKGTGPQNLNKAGRRSSFFLLLVLCLCASVLQNKAWAGGDASDGHTHAPEPDVAAATTDTSAGVSQTSLQLRLADLAKSGAGTEAPLQNAELRGIVKEATTGKTLSRISAHSTDTPGTYDVHFGGDNETFAFPGPGRYELELNIKPANGEAISTTVPFTLAAAASPVGTSAAGASAAGTQPLWRRAIPFVLGALALIVLFLLARKLLARRRKTPPGAPGETRSHAPESASTALLLMVLLGAALCARTVWAHEGEVHGDEEEPAAAAPPACCAGRAIERAASGDNFDCNGGQHPHHGHCAHPTCCAPNPRAGRSNLAATDCRAPKHPNPASAGFPTGEPASRSRVRSPRTLTAPCAWRPLCPAVSRA